LKSVTVDLGIVRLVQNLRDARVLQSSVHRHKRE